MDCDCGAKRSGGVIHEEGVSVSGWEWVCFVERFDLKVQEKWLSDFAFLLFLCLLSFFLFSFSSLSIGRVSE